MNAAAQVGQRTITGAARGDSQGHDCMVVESHKEVPIGEQPVEPPSLHRVSMDGSAVELVVPGGPKLVPRIQLASIACSGAEYSSSRFDGNVMPANSIGMVSFL